MAVAPAVEHREHLGDVSCAHLLDDLFVGDRRQVLLHDHGDSRILCALNVVLGRPYTEDGLDLRHDFGAISQGRPDRQPISVGLRGLDVQAQSKAELIVPLDRSQAIVARDLR
jgi:hypothetical protein